MKKLLKFWVILTAVGLTAGLMFGLTGCGDSDGGNGDTSGTTEGYTKYYDGDYRNNRNGDTTVLNNTSFDMLLFEGEFIGRERIVGGVKGGSNATLNFSNETDYVTGGYKLLRAVRQSVFEAQGNQSKVDHSVMASYRRNAPTTVSITSTTDGDYHYIVHNMSSRFSLQLRQDSAQGKVVAFLTKGERNRVIQTSSANQLLLYPVWIGYSTQTMEIVEFAPTEPFTAQPVQPESTGSGNPAPPLHFPRIGNGQEINFPIKAPTAVVRVMNTFSSMANFRSGNQPFNAIGAPATPTGTGINSGNWRSFNVDSGGGPIDLNIYLQTGPVTIPIRFADSAALPTLQDGYYYHITFEHTPGLPLIEPTSYKAVLSQQGAIDTGNGLYPIASGKTGIYTLSELTMGGIPAGGEFEFTGFNIGSGMSTITVPAFSAKNGVIYSFTFNGSSVVKTVEQTIIF